MTMKRYSVFLPEQLKDAIEAKAKRTGTPTAEHIRAAIAAYCEPKPAPNFDGAVAGWPRDNGPG